MRTIASIISALLCLSACVTLRPAKGHKFPDPCRELTWDELSTEFSRAVTEAADRGYTALSIRLTTGPTYATTVAAFGPGDESDELDVLLSDGSRITFPIRQIEPGDTLWCPITWGQGPW